MYSMKKEEEVLKDKMMLLIQCNYLKWNFIYMKHKSLTASTHKSISLKLYFIDPFTSYHHSSLLSMSCLSRKSLLGMYLIQIVLVLTYYWQTIMPLFPVQYTPIVLSSRKNVIYRFCRWAYCLIEDQSYAKGI